MDPLAVDWNDPAVINVEKTLVLEFKKFKARGPPGPFQGGPKEWMGPSLEGEERSVGLPWRPQHAVGRVPGEVRQGARHASIPRGRGPTPQLAARSLRCE
eukprot:3878369-Pyramimonas_sp.AAC.1